MDYDEVLMDVEEILQQHYANPTSPILTEQLHFQAKLLQAIAKLELHDMEPGGNPEMMREIHDNLRAAINLNQVLTDRDGDPVYLSAGAWDLSFKESNNEDITFLKTKELQ